MCGMNWKDKSVGKETGREATIKVHMIRLNPRRRQSERKE